ncbi:hypothetical protein [Streptomyces subrutilus]|uniref:Uncharacterized protein n=1 Tax=Streptomyces subrutilus TaxID=36818 RepID=A0A1E5Q0X6_9ACTN|nr:hypothetical protein [Streptomyces subrutilus]OEJ35467.1 hypothetical protein BGK67_04280 [Streptomyces subrutilus]
MDVEEVVDTLYALPPARFTAARDEAAAEAKRTGDRTAGRRIAGLRRPTLAAWTSNTLVRAKPDEVERFRALGQALRAAHRSLDGAQLRALSHQQHVVIGALAREAVRLAAEAGTAVSETVLREVEQILRAALADPDAAETWASGRLTRTPAAATEFPGVDPGAVPPTPPAPPAPAPAPAPAPEPEAERGPDPRVAAARAAARDAGAEAAAREEELREAEEARQRAADEAAAADAELERARAARDQAHTAVAEAERRRREAARAAGKARRAADTADRRLHTLTAEDGAGGGARGGGGRGRRSPR